MKLVLHLPVFQPSLPQTGPDLLAAGGEDVVVELQLLLVWQRDVSVQPRLHNTVQYSTVQYNTV